MRNAALRIRNFRRWVVDEGEMEKGIHNPQSAIRNPQSRSGSDIADRLLRLATAVVKRAEKMPRTQIARHVGVQWMRSVTGAGSNYGESRFAESRDDFIHKVAISAKELREAAYWADLVCAVGFLPAADINGIARETKELIAILGASLRTARRNNAQSNR